MTNLIKWQGEKYHNTEFAHVPWDGKLFADKAEIRYDYGGTNVLVVVSNTNKAYKYSWTGEEYGNVAISMNGTLVMSEEQYKDMLDAIQEASDKLLWQAGYE